MFRPVRLLPVAVILSTLACTVSLPTTTRLVGSGDIVTVEPDVADFDRLEISHAFETTITQGDVTSVVIRIDDNLEPYLRVEQQGRTLAIGLADEVGLGFLTATLEADITMPSLVALEASGASQAMLIDIVSGDDVSLDASGASRIEGELEAARLDLILSGASAASLRGTAEDLHLDASGASTADMERFPVADASVVVSGASSASVDVSGTLDVDASGASHVTYSGSPSLGEVNISGASSIDAE
jgi:hypothetical protein